MKTKVILTVLSFLLMGNFAFAQKYGATPEDSISCLRNLSLYSDYVKQKNYEGAHQFWLDALTNCPASTANLYIHGVTIMRELINTTTDPALRQARIDTLINLYDQRMSLFSNSNFSDIYDRKARDLNAYRPDDAEGIHTALVKSIEYGREKTDASTMVFAMQKTLDLYQSEKLSAEEVISFYTTVIEYANAQVKAEPASEKLQSAQRDINTLFATSDVASCENLIAIFTPRLQENPEDKDLIINIVRLLGQKDCIRNDLYVQAAGAYHRLDPSGGSAYALARMTSRQEDYQASIEWYREAINLTNGADTVSQYLTDLAKIYFGPLNNQSRAISTIREAISKDSKNGEAYKLMGQIWAAQKCGGDDANSVDARAMYWVIVDYFQKAKNADPSLASEVNGLINSYSKHFPSQSDAFMLDIMDGQPYTVTCGGMTEQTIVRTRKD